MKYRKKPVVVEAFPARDAISHASRQWEKLPQWLQDEYEKGNVLFRNAGIDIKTLEGTMTALPGDWIIRGIKGELYPCKPDIFEATYELVEESAAVGFGCSDDVRGDS